MLIASLFLYFLEPNQAGHGRDTFEFVTIIFSRLFLCANVALIFAGDYLRVKKYLTDCIDFSDISSADLFFVLKQAQAQTFWPLGINPTVCLFQLRCLFTSRHHRHHASLKRSPRKKIPHEYSITPKCVGTRPSSWFIFQKLMILLLRRLQRR
jgi:hypothetical protein